MVLHRPVELAWVTGQMKFPFFRNIRQVLSLLGLLSIAKYQFVDQLR